jgi:hypothetical protein
MRLPAWIEAFRRRSGLRRFESNLWNLRATDRLVEQVLFLEFVRFRRQ